MAKDKKDNLGKVEDTRRRDEDASKAPKGANAGQQDYFMNAYRRRLEEKRAEESRRRGEVREDGSSKRSDDGARWDEDRRSRDDPPEPRDRERDRGERGVDRGGERDRADKRRRGEDGEDARKEDKRKAGEDDREQRRREELERKAQEEERRLRLEAERRKKEEDRRKHEEELQRRRDEKRRREEEERKKVEEIRRKEREEDDRRRREERERERAEERKRNEELMKKKAEEDAKREVEEAKKREEEAKALRQQKATLNVLRVLQKFSNTTPENFEALHAELEGVLETELPETGAQHEILKAEANRVRECAKQYVEQVREQQKKLDEQKKVQLQKQEQQEKAARAVLEELQKLVVAAEQASEAAHYTAAPLAGDNELENSAVIRIAMEVEKSGRVAMSACSACADFLVQKRSVIDEAESIRGETTSQLLVLQPRIQSATRQATEALQRASGNKTRIARKLAWPKRTEKLKATWDKYDKDRDGFLNREDIIFYASSEFHFDIPAINLERICRHLIKKGATGVAYADVQALKTAVGIARDEDRGRRKVIESLEKARREQEEAERRRKLAGEKKVELLRIAKGLVLELDQLKPTFKVAEAEAQTMMSEAAQLSIEALKLKAKAVEDAAGPARDALEAIKARVLALGKEVAELPELQSVLGPELIALNASKDVYEVRLKAFTDIAGNGRQLALQKAFAEREAQRTKIAAQLRVCIETKGGKADDLYDVIAPEGMMTRDDIRVYLESHSCEVDPRKLALIFVTEEEHVEGQEARNAAEAAAKAESEVPAAGADAGAGVEGEHVGNNGDAENGKAAPMVGVAAPALMKRAAIISKEDFMRAIKIYYKVIKEIVISDNLLIEQSRQIRRMDVGEVIEVIQGPMLDPSVGVYRVRGKALRDGISGWVTLAGNQGVTFLLPGGNVLQVMHPAPLTKDVEGTELVRTLQVGQVLEVLEWARTPSPTNPQGITRVKAKIQGEDSAVGWATTVDAEGVVFLEAS